MGLESSPTTIVGLDATWPLSTDDPKYGDDHLRNIKAVLKALDTAGGELRGRLVSVQKFAADGTWTRPAGVRYLVVEGKGGGGGGAGNRASTYQVGGGGGEGGYCKELINVTAITSVAVTVGDGGAGGVQGENGSDGESTTFGAHFTAGGGGGGQANTLTSGKNLIRGGDGGVASGGDINLPGVCGQAPYYGGAAGPFVSGAGGGQGGGHALSIGAESVNGVAGAANSGGGGGAADQLASYSTGGAGGSGYVVVWEYT